MCSQVFASGTGNRRHPLFFLGYPRSHQAPHSEASQQDRLNVRKHKQAPARRSASPLPVTGASFAHAGSPSKQAGLLAVFGRVSPVRLVPAVKLSLGAGAAQKKQPFHQKHEDLQPADSCSSLEHPAMSATPGSSACGSSKGGSTCTASDSGKAGEKGVWTADGQLRRALEPSDVAAERQRVQGLADFGAHPLVVKALHKVYPAQDGQPPKVKQAAVFDVERETASAPGCRVSTVTSAVCTWC